MPTDTANRTPRVPVRLWGTAALVALALALGLPVAARAGSDESAMVSMVASSRSSAHVGGLATSSALAGIARKQADRMRAAGRIYHNPNLSSELNAAGLSWSVAGENVGVGPRVDDIERAFMNSAEHRRNILDGRYNAIGIGIVEAGDRIYVAQVFAQLGTTASRTTSAPAKPVAKAATVPASAPAKAAKPVGSLFRAEDGSFVRTSFYREGCGHTLVAEDGSRVRASFYGTAC